MESIKVVSNDLFSLLNRLFTAILLVILLFACQDMSDGRKVDGVQLKYQSE
jgi:hypothetical protein